MASLMGSIGKKVDPLIATERRKSFFDAALYILNKMWDKIDNFRIDKFLGLLRHLFAQALLLIKENQYATELTSWMNEILLNRILLDDLAAQGIALQISDIFVVELGKIDSKNISMDQMAALLDPFMVTISRSNSEVLKMRIIEKVFLPLLESNVTVPDSDDDTSDSDKEEQESEEEDLALVDGGKMSRRTRKAVLALINEKYVFKNFNILIYAENYIFPLASLAMQPSVADSTAEGTENSEDVEGDAEKVTDKKQIPKKDEEKEA